jgi:hypothetical protein
MIKTDPNQKSTVIVLVVILVGALVATVVRCLPGPQPKQSAQQAQQTTTEVSPVASVSEADYEPNRNPFQQPLAIKDRVKSALKRLGGPSDEEIMAMIGPPAKQANPWSRQGSVRVEPIKLPQVMVPRQGEYSTAQSGAVQVEAKKLPEFALLATVKNNTGLCAVIRGSDSKPKVVEVGDIIEGFMVTRLDLDQAVLSDGRDTIVAKRPKV